MAEVALREFIELSKKQIALIQKQIELAEKLLVSSEL